MIDQAQLFTLNQVLSTGSFDKAAQALNITPSAVSQRIKALEEQLGTILIRRGQPCTGTPAGIRLARHATDVGLLETALFRDLKLEEGPLTPIRIALNADSLSTWVMPALASVQGLLYDIIVDDQDHSADWLRRGEVAAAITTYARPIQGCDAKPLGRLRYFATASPEFVDRWFPNGINMQALAAAPTLTFNQKDRLQRDWIQTETGCSINPPTHWLPSSTAFVDASLQSVGWGLNPEILIRDHLAAGRLIKLSDKPTDVPLLWQWSRLTASALNPLTEAIHKTAATLLLQPV